MENKKVTISDDFLSLVERSFELSNLDEIYDMSRQRLIWGGVEEIERI